MYGMRILCTGSVYAQIYVQTWAYACMCAHIMHAHLCVHCASVCLCVRAYAYAYACVREYMLYFSWSMLYAHTGLCMRGMDVCVHLHVLIVHTQTVQ